MKPGEWVSFWTKNCPDDAQIIPLTSDEAAESEAVTGQGLYMGRGRVVRVREDGALLVAEEGSSRLVEVAHGERVEPLAREYRALTLGDLRRFLEDNKEATDDIPVNVLLPVEFFCDLDDVDLEEGHPDKHEPCENDTVPACGILFTAFEANSDTSLDRYIPPDQRQPGEDWQFGIEIVPNGQEAHDALRGEEHE